MLALAVFLCISSSSIDDDEAEDFLWGMDEDEAPQLVEWDDVPVEDIIILGSGPAGNTAALYAARAGYKPLVLHGGVPGGQLTTTTEIENFPAFKGTGPDLVAKMQEQAMEAGAVYESQKVTIADLSVFPRRLESEHGVRYRCKSLIIATGATAKYLGLESETRLRNKGVSACAICDGGLYKGEDVVVVGGGDVAVEEALFLSKFCKSVTLIHRRDSLAASLPMRKKLEASTVKITWNSVLTDVLGDEFVTGAEITNVKTGEKTTMKCAAVFIAIGHIPATQPFKGQLDMDQTGYFVTDGSPNTKIPGVYVAGDCADKVFRQAITSAGSGCQAAMLAEQYLLSI